MVGKTRQTTFEFEGYEFFGPIGTGIITIALPLVVYAGPFLCNDVYGCPVPSVLSPSTLTLQQLKKETNWPGFDGLFSSQAFVYVLGWYLWMAVLNAFLPGEIVEGDELRIGGRHKYKMTTFSSALVTLAVVGAGSALYGAEWGFWRYITDNYLQILTSNILIAFFLACYCYVGSFSVADSPKHLKRELAPGGLSGNLMYDWFIGREMNPRITLPILGEIDIKYFMEVKPGIVGQIILNLANLARQYRTFGYVTPSMAIVCFNLTWYAMDCFYNEPLALYVLDITMDGFGFMLAFGDLVWLPFFYTWQTRYLSMHPVALSSAQYVTIFTVLAVGYYIFRSSNSQKTNFRKDPDGAASKGLQYIQTKRGTRLLVSGWWGIARHINYLGDWIVSWAYCLPTGLAGFTVVASSALKLDHSSSNMPPNSAFIPDGYDVHGGREIIPGAARGWGVAFTYLYMVYFAVLLIHRDRRDDLKCRRKYGKDWEEYTKRVPYRIIPGIY